jgi:putative ABC transport system ATP-binding protein
VAIARALVNDPVLILADEPTGALDSRTSVEVMALLQQLNREGMTVVIVTHEQDIAAFTSRIVMFRDGSVVSDLAHPARDAAQALAEVVDPAAQAMPAAEAPPAVTRPLSP